MINKILIAVDDSPSAMHAADYGIRLAKKLGAKVGVISVTHHNVGNIDGGLMPVEVEKALQRRNNMLMDEIAITHPKFEIEEFDPIGRPDNEIENVIELWKPHLLVLGHHKHGIIERLMNRSIERNLIKNIKIPILIVPEN